MQVGDAHVVWREGEVVLFDDTQPHEVWNETAEERVVLLIDVRRPMRPAGRALLASLMAILAQTPFVKHAVRNELAWEQGVGTELALGPDRRVVRAGAGLLDASRVEAGRDAGARRLRGGSRGRSGGGPGAKFAGAGDPASL